MENQITLESRRPIISMIVLFASIAFHLATIPLFIFVAIPNNLYAESIYVFYFFLASSIGIAIAMYLARWKSQFRILLLFRVLVLLAIGLPFHQYPAIQMTLLLILLLEANIYEDFPFSMIFCSLMLTVIFAVSILDYLLVEHASAVALYGLCIYLLSATLVAGVSGFMSLYREKMLTFGKRIQRMDAIVADLTNAQMGYLEFAKNAEERSTLAERKRLSSELHDTVGYTFTNLMMMLAAAQDLADSDRLQLKDLLHAAFEQAQQGLSETRKTLYLLREQEERKPPFLAAVHKLVDMFEKATGVHVVVEYTNFPMSCDDGVESALYHFIQEGLTNSFLHGKASNVEIIFWIDEEIYQIILRDDGLGVGKINEGIGILGMRERLGKLGGTLSLHRIPVGFELMAQIPIRG